MLIRLIFEVAGKDLGTQAGVWAGTDEPVCIVGAFVCAVCMCKGVEGKGTYT